MELNHSPDHRSDYLRNVALDVVLTLLFCGLWNLVLQYYQCKSLNYLLKEEKYQFWKLSLYSLLTCGIYYFYHEYSKAVDFGKITGNTDSSDPILALVLSFFGLSFIYDAILQSKMNDFLKK